MEADMKKGNIDVHCHFFNGRFAFEELLEIGWRWLHDEYPYKSDELRRSTTRLKVPLPAFIEEFINYVASLFSTITRKPEENYKYEQQCYKGSRWGTSDPLITVPLMMDIFFLFDKGAANDRKSRIRSLPAAQMRSALGPVSIDEDQLPSFDEFANEMKERVMQAIAEKSPPKKTRALSSVTKRTDSVSKELDLIIEEFKTPAAAPLRVKGARSSGNVQMTRGYRHHLEALSELRKKNADTVLPFLAVDPRRIGIEQLVTEYVIHGDFHGVKLYCPLGYLPSHPDLHQVFKLCLDNRIPITTHTSPGGFPSQCREISTLSRKKDGSVVHVFFNKSEFEKTHKPEKGESAQSLFFADPEKWLEVLESGNFGKLRVNFAHFGGEDNIRKYAEGKADQTNWTAKIINLMERFENVYADVSYCPGSGMLGYIDTIIKQNPIVGKRLMFGTDFVMIMMNQCGLRNYFNSYTGIKTQMVTTNPTAFLW